MNSQSFPGVCLETSSHSPLGLFCFVLFCFEQLGKCLATATGKFQAEGQGYAQEGYREKSRFDVYGKHQENTEKNQGGKRLGTEGVARPSNLPSVN